MSILAGDTESGWGLLTPVFWFVFVCFALFFLAVCVWLWVYTAQSTPRDPKEWADVDWSDTTKD